MAALAIRPARIQDLAALEAVARHMGDTHEIGYFQRCLHEQEQGKRQLLVYDADEMGALAGYAQLNWHPLYPSFRRFNIPEIQDLNVVPSARRQGLGASLVGACEDLAREKSCENIGISVGLHAKFGAAQRLYVRLGYVPDGAGLCHDDIPCNYADVRAVDDLLTLKLIKSLN